MLGLIFDLWDNNFVLKKLVPISDMILNFIPCQYLPAFRPLRSPFFCKSPIVKALVQ